MPIESVRKHVIVEATPERAFRIFTESSSWWPRGHHISEVDFKSVVLEPRQGGRWFERGVDGSECEWGRVLVWDPPKRLVLAWQIAADWKFDTNFITEVDVRFTPAGMGKTRVDLEHRDLERFGAAASNQRTALDSEGGWILILNNYVQAVSTAPVEA